MTQEILKTHAGSPIPSALIGNKENLSPEARKEIQNLTQPAPGPFLLQAFYAWSIILGTISVAMRMHMAAINVIALLIIATRQNILALLVHEQAHCLAFRSRKGEALADLVAGYPLLISVDDYANVHLTHHTFYFTEKDPDYRRKQGHEWTFPMKPPELAGLFFLDLLGFNTIKNLHGKKMREHYLGKRKTATPQWVRALFMGLVSLGLTAAHLWRAAMFYWLLPLVTIFQIIIRWGALCEHKYNLIDPSLEESTPLIKLKGWERLIFPNLNFTYHVYHHYYPGIPFFRLPEVHRIYQREHRVNELNVFRGYGMFLSYIFRPKKRPPFTPSAN